MPCETNTATGKTVPAHIKTAFKLDLQSAFSYERDCVVNVSLLPDSLKVITPVCRFLILMPVQTESQELRGIIIRRNSTLRVEVDTLEYDP
jgi:hypothetical protein